MRWLIGAPVIAGVCFAVALMIPLADRLLLFPTTAAIDPHGATKMNVPFNGGSVEVWKAQSRAMRDAPPEFYVLRFYGNADRAEHWVADEAEEWNGRPVEVWGMNYPGYGGSTGPAQLKQIAPATLTIFDQLRDRAVDRPVVLFGTSLGSAAALHVAAKRPVAGLILQNPPPIRQIILRGFGWWNLWLLAGPVAAQIPHELDSIANGKVVKVPAIFLLAEQDEIVAPRFQKLVVDAYAGEKRIIRLPAAQHNSPIEGAAMAELHGAQDWLLQRNAPVGRAGPPP
jgi:pimeloyl-ACP methyl ester carboxylesterase